MKEPKERPAREATRTGRKLSKPPFRTDILAGNFGRHALELADRGLAVFRLPPGVKVPFSGSRGYLDATTDPEQIRSWWAETPEANIGIATGSRSGGLVVADIDRPDKARLAGSSTLKLPSSPLVKTRRGYHIYGLSADPLASQTLPWGELLAEGRYVVAPPSITDGLRRDWTIPFEWESPISVSALTSFLPGLRETRPRESALSGSNPATATISGSDRLHEALGAEDYGYLVGCEEVAAALIVAYGLPAIGRKFNCPLHPGHKHANLWRAEDGAVRWYCHSREGNQNLCLGRLYAVLRTGTQPQTKNQLAYWARRLVVDLGFAESQEVYLPPLPEGLPASRHKLRQVAEDVFRIWGTSQPRPLATRFLQEQSGLAKQTVLDAKGELLRLGVIRKVGEHRSGHPTPMALYLPGH